MPDETSMLRDEERRFAVVFGTLVGGQLHMIAPVVVVSASGQAISISGLRSDRHKQLGMAINRGYLLLGDEMDGRRPLVIDLRDGSTRLQVSGWVPPG